MATKKYGVLSEEDILDKIRGRSHKQVSNVRTEGESKPEVTLPPVPSKKETPHADIEALDNYRQRYLLRQQSPGRHRLSVNDQLYRKLALVTSMLGSGRLNMSSYLNNILEEHFESHDREYRQIVAGYLDPANKSLENH